MTEQDNALTVSNPRLLAAIYFGLLAVIANQIIDTFLYNMGVEELLPAFKAIMLAVIVAAPFGALFGERIVHSPKPYKMHVFWWGFLMVIVALPFHTLGFLFLFKAYHPQFFEHAGFFGLLKIYLLVLSYSFILFGLWLAILGGVAAIYLRSKLVYYLLDSLYIRRKTSKDAVIKPKTVKYGQATVSTDSKNNHST